MVQAEWSERISELLSDIAAGNTDTFLQDELNSLRELVALRDWAQFTAQDGAVRGWPSELQRKNPVLELERDELYRQQLLSYYRQVINARSDASGRRMRNAGVPDVAACLVSSGKYVERSYVKTLDIWLASLYAAKPLLVLRGRGLGRTTACAMAIASCHHTNWSDRPLYRSAEDINKLPNDVPDILVSSLLLAVDDVGTEPKHLARAVSSAICRRVDHGRPTIVTTRLDSIDLLKWLGDRMQWRLESKGLEILLTDD